MISSALVVVVVLCVGWAGIFVGLVSMGLSKWYIDNLEGEVEGRAMFEH